MNSEENSSEIIEDQSPKKKEKKKETKGEFFRSLIFALVLALLFRSLAFEPFYIPSGSMKSTLLVGDYVFVKKYSYGYSRYSFPLGLPIFEGRKFDKKPQRGDSIVFKLPTNTRINYIKRLVGMPGDKIQVKKGILYINGEEVKREKIEDFIEKDDLGDEIAVSQYIETLPNGVKYKVLDMYSNAPLDNTPIYKVPENHYFMMGDNRDNSTDSRVLNAVGYVPEENLLGPARWIFFSSEESFLKFWTWPTALRFNRFFSSIDMKNE